MQFQVYCNLYVITSYTYMPMWIFVIVVCYSSIADRPTHLGLLFIHLWYWLIHQWINSSVHQFSLLSILNSILSTHNSHSLIISFKKFFINLLIHSSINCVGPYIIPFKNLFTHLFFHPLFIHPFISHPFFYSTSLCALNFHFLGRLK